MLNLYVSGEHFIITGHFIDEFNRMSTPWWFYSMNCGLSKMLSQVICEACVVIGIADKSIAIAMLRHLLNLQNYLYTPNQKSLRKWQNVQISCSDINSHQATFVMLKICLWSCIGSIIFGVHAPGRTWNLFEWYQSIGTI